MNGLEPYDHSYPAPIALSGGARFVRGFGRIGLVVAILIGIGGAIMTYFLAHEEAQKEINRVWQRQCIRAKFVQLGDKLPRQHYSEKNVDLWEAGCTGPESTLPLKTISSLQPEAPPEYGSVLIYNLGLGALITICVAAVPWLFFVTVGWIAAGFTRF